MISGGNENFRSRGFGIASFAVGLGLACAVGVATAAAAPAAPTTGHFSVPLGMKQSLPEIGQYSPASSAPLSGTDLTRERTKEQQANGFIAKVRAYRAQTGASPATAPAKYNLGEPFEQQMNEDWCGAATTAMVADYLGLGFGHSASDGNAEQTSAGHLLDTTSNGTAWSGHDNVPYYPGTSSYPVEDVLNYQAYEKYGTGDEWYTAVNLPGSPTSSQQSQFVTNLVYDILAGHPEADNQDSITNYNLPWQPNGDWQHWLSARGYESSGNTTGVNDPAAWSQRQEHWVTTKGGQHTLVVALGDRGYIW